MNASSPPNARTIRDQPNPIKVEARVVWEVDGEEWVPGTATRWTQRHVLVALNDKRCLPIDFWLDPGDVRRLQADRA